MISIEGTRKKPATERALLRNAESKNKGLERARKSGSKSALRRRHFFVEILETKQLGWKYLTPRCNFPVYESHRAESLLFRVWLASPFARDRGSLDRRTFSGSSVPSIRGRRNFFSFVGSKRERKPSYSESRNLRATYVRVYLWYVVVVCKEIGISLSWRVLVRRVLVGDKR